jgi:hypothetical protein
VSHMTEEAFYPELHETKGPRGVAKTSPEVAAELYLAPRANLKGRAISADATMLVSFLDKTYPRPTKAGAQKAVYRAGGKLAAQRCQTIAAWLAELLISAVVEDGGGWLAVSLDKTTFKNRNPVSWRTFDGVRKPWIAAGLLEENTGFPGILAFGNPGPLVGRLSRFRATPRLLEICKSNGITVENADEHFAVEFDMPSELVRITSPPMPTRNTPDVQRMRDEVAALNVFFAEHKLEGARHIGWVRMFHEATSRDFNFDKGGRLYSQPWVPKLNYQHMPRESRTELKIDGEQLSEIDISGSYLTIYHAAHGHEVDVAGAYEDILGPEGIDRAIVKAWVNASFGNRGLLGQWSPGIKKDFAKKYRSEGWEIDPKKYPVKHVREAVLARHPLLASWGQQAPGIPSSYGDLMFQESRAIISTMVRLATEHFIPSAPVHDSLLVPRSKVAVARRLLQQQFKDVLGVTPLLKVYPSLA